MFTALILARIIHFTAALLLFGAVVFPFYALEKGETRGLGEAEFAAYRGLATAALLSGLLWLAGIIVGAIAGPITEIGVPRLLRILTDTEFGRAWCLRFALNIALLTTLAFPGARNAKYFRAGMASMSGLFVATLAGIGHAAAGQGASGVARLLVQCVHLLCAGFWLGGLLRLGLHLAKDRRTAHFERSARALNRFSFIGCFAVAAILVTGIANIHYTSNAFIPRLATEYGRLLTLKIALVLAAVALALFNRLWVLPRLGARTQAAGMLSRSVLAEQALLLGAICVVALLGETSPMG